MYTREDRRVNTQKATTKLKAEDLPSEQPTISKRDSLSHASKSETRTVRRKSSKKLYTNTKPNDFISDPAPSSTNFQVQNNLEQQRPTQSTFIPSSTTK